MQATGHTRNDGPDERLRAPEHLVNMLLAVMPSARRTPGVVPPPRGSVTYARAARAEAQVYADRIWAEAYHAGATDTLSRYSRPMRVELTGEHAAQLVRSWPTAGEADTTPEKRT